MDYKKAAQEARDNNDPELAAFFDEQSGESVKPSTKQNPERQQKIKFLLKLIQARQKAHLTQAGLAEKVGMSQSSLARIESGQGNPTLSTLLKLAEALDVKIELQGRP